MFAYVSVRECKCLICAYVNCMCMHTNTRREYMLRINPVWSWEKTAVDLHLLVPQVSKPGTEGFTHSELQNGY